MTTPKMTFRGRIAPVRGSSRKIHAASGNKTACGKTYQRYYISAGLRLTCPRCVKALRP